MNTPSQVEQIDLACSDAATLLALFELQQTVHAEHFPGDVPPPVAVRLAEWRQGGACWLIREPGTQLPIANAWIELPDAAQERDLLVFNILVHPAHRCQGHGRSLLATIAGIAQQEGRQRLSAQSSQHIPAGAAFLQHMGATPGFTQHTLQLDLQRCAQAQLQPWVARLQQRAPEIALETWQHDLPEADHAALAQLQAVHDGVFAPDDAPALVQERIAQLRQDAAQLRAQQKIHWCVVARAPHGAIVGVSDVIWRAQHPAMIEQGITAVLPAWRNRGLAHALKSALIICLREQQPQACWLRTGNRADNIPMLKTNADLGFTLLSEDCWWELSLPALRVALEQCGGK